MRRWLAVVLSLAASTCGGSAPTSPSGSGGGTGDPTITITSAGVAPTSMTVTQGTRVLFINNDTHSHDMASNPHPEHTDCIELNQVGFLDPGQSRESGNLNTVRTCGYHDHADPDNPKWHGQIIVH
jgi:hypothetical protein